MVLLEIAFAPGLAVPRKPNPSDGLHRHSPPPHEDPFLLPGRPVAWPVDDDSPLYASLPNLFKHFRRRRVSIDEFERTYDVVVETHAALATDPRPTASGLFPARAPDAAPRGAALGSSAKRGGFTPATKTGGFSVRSAKADFAAVKLHRAPGASGVTAGVKLWLVPKPPPGTRHVFTRDAQLVDESNTGLHGGHGRRPEPPLPRTRLSCCRTSPAATLHRHLQPAGHGQPGPSVRQLRGSERPKYGASSLRAGTITAAAPTAPVGAHPYAPNTTTRGGASSTAAAFSSPGRSVIPSSEAGHDGPLFRSLAGQFSRAATAADSTVQRNTFALGSAYVPTGPQGSVLPDLTDLKQFLASVDATAALSALTTAGGRECPEHRPVYFPDDIPCCTAAEIGAVVGSSKAAYFIITEAHRWCMQRRDRTNTGNRTTNNSTVDQVARRLGAGSGPAGSGREAAAIDWYFRILQLYTKYTRREEEARRAKAEAFASPLAAVRRWHGIDETDAMVARPRLQGHPSSASESAATRLGEHVPVIFGDGAVPDIAKLSVMELLKGYDGNEEELWYALREKYEPEAAQASTVPTRQLVAHIRRSSTSQDGEEEDVATRAKEQAAAIVDHAQPTAASSTEEEVVVVDATSSVASDGNDHAGDRPARHESDSRTSRSVSQSGSTQQQVSAPSDALLRPARPEHEEVVVVSTTGQATSASESRSNSALSMKSEVPRPTTQQQDVEELRRLMDEERRKAQEAEAQARRLAAVCDEQQQWISLLEERDALRRADAQPPPQLVHQHDAPANPEPSALPAHPTTPTATTMRKSTPGNQAAPLYPFDGADFYTRSGDEEGTAAGQPSVRRTAYSYPSSKSQVPSEALNVGTADQRGFVANSASVGNPKPHATASTAAEVKQRLMAVPLGQGRPPRTAGDGFAEDDLRRADAWHAREVHEYLSQFER